MSWGIAFRARQYVKSSLWLVPLLGGMAGLALAELSVWLDAGDALPVLQYSPETATAVRCVVRRQRRSRLGDRFRPPGHRRAGDLPGQWTRTRLNKEPP
jgi:hypothetical protein